VFDVQNEAQWERDAENANRIFHIIHKSAPHLLGRLVLRSVVSGYTNDNALPLLENVQMALRSKIADSREWAFVDACNSPASSRRKSTDTKLNPLFDYDEDFFTSPQNAVVCTISLVILLVLTPCDYGYQAQDEFCLWEVTLALAFLNAQNYNAKYVSVQTFLFCQITSPQQIIELSKTCSVCQSLLLARISVYTLNFCLQLGRRKLVSHEHFVYLREAVPTPARPLLLHYR